MGRMDGQVGHHGQNQGNERMANGGWRHLHELVRTTEGLSVLQPDIALAILWQQF